MGEQDSILRTPIPHANTPETVLASRDVSSPSSFISSSSHSHVMSNLECCDKIKLLIPSTDRKFGAFTRMPNRALSGVEGLVTCYLSLSPLSHLSLSLSLTLWGRRHLWIQCGGGCSRGQASPRIPRLIASPNRKFGNFTGMPNRALHRVEGLIT